MSQQAPRAFLQIDLRLELPQQLAGGAHPAHRRGRPRRRCTSRHRRRWAWPPCRARCRFRICQAKPSSRDVLLVDQVQRRIMRLAEIAAGGEPLRRARWPRPAGARDPPCRWARAAAAAARAPCCRPASAAASSTASAAPPEDAWNGLMIPPKDLRHVVASLCPHDRPRRQGLPPLRGRDLAHVWHPCTQMKDHERELPLIPIRSGQGVWLEDYGRPALPGRHQLLVGEPVRPCQPGDQRGGGRAAGRTGACDLRRVHP